MLHLPAELWKEIFDYATDEDVLSRYGLPTVMAEYAWYKPPYFDEWVLRSPQAAFNEIQKDSYKTKRRIKFVCREWRQIAAESLFTCLYFNDPTQIQALAHLLDSSPSSSSASLGWWTKRIQVSTWRGTPMPAASIAEPLVSIIRHCPNIEIFALESPFPDVASFGSIADTLATYTSKSLRTVSWKLPAAALPKVIWALASIPLLLAAHIEFESTSTGSEQEDEIHLGCASDVHLKFPYLQQLSLKGSFAEFLSQAMGWSIPSLRSLALDCGHARNEQPDIEGFLALHGVQLTFLDIFSVPPLDVPKILAICPLLHTFCFNADWRLAPPPSIDAEAEVSSTLTHAPHLNITCIGLHGLLHAFGVGYAASYSSIEPLTTHIIRRSNDLNVTALFHENKKSFPKLQSVRVLNRSVLLELNKAGGPSEDEGGLQRWERWWGGLWKVGVRLEDCTGGELGVLPGEEVESDSDSEEEDEPEGEEGDSYYSSEDEWEIDIPPLPSNGEGISELAKLLEECRAMAEDREEPMFGPMAGAPVVVVNGGKGPI